LPSGVRVALTGHPRSFAFGFSPRTQIALTVISAVGRGLPVCRCAKARARGGFQVFDLSDFKVNRARRRLYRRGAIAREGEDRQVGFAREAPGTLAIGLSLARRVFLSGVQHAYDFDALSHYLVDHDVVRVGDDFACAWHAARAIQVRMFCGRQYGRLD